MNAEQTAIARKCLDGAYDHSVSFPEGVMALIAAGFDGYLVDFRASERTCYLPDGETLVLKAPGPEGPVAIAFDRAEVVAAIRWAQAAPADYSYAGFNARVTAAGCAGYLVSFPGRRVLYFGRDGETHTEFFPS